MSRQAAAPVVTRFLLCWLAILAWRVSPAFGGEKDPRAVQAQKDCLSGKTDSGVALLAELYAENHNPNFIYNQARCYEQAARPEDALNRFREYLRVAKNLPASERADVEKHMEECRALAAEQEHAREVKAAAIPLTPPAAVAAPAPSLLPEAARPEAVQSAAGLELTAPPQPTESTPIYGKWWFWTGIVAVVAGGVTAYFLATHHSTETYCSGASITCVAAPK